jgi:ABC-2 type transport system ATP-binding protein
MREVALQDSTGAAIQVQGLRRVFGAKVALEGATFEVRRGEVFGFLGPNGAGKTTTIRVLTGLLRPTAGQAWILGKAVSPDSADAKALFGYVPDEPAFPAPLKAMPLLRAYARFYGMAPDAAERRARELLQLVALGDQGPQRIRTFSHGMRKRFALAQALLHDPPLLILDEPSSGLDPAGTAWFRDFLRALRDQGKTVFLSSHLLHEVEQVCDRVGIIHGGRVLAVDRIDNLARRVRGRSEIRVVASGVSAAVLAEVRALPGVLNVRQDGTDLAIEAGDPGLAPEVNAALVKAGARVSKLDAGEPDLEEIFLAMTGAPA